jgi:hypothetical protein
MISTGTARKNSTNTAQGQRRNGSADSLPTPSRKPSTNASAMDRPAALSVPSMPGTMYVSHTSGSRKGCHFAPSS